MIRVDLESRVVEPDFPQRLFDFPYHSDRRGAKSGAWQQHRAFARLRALNRGKREGV
jgi:hypothetical protein